MAKWWPWGKERLQHRQDSASYGERVSRSQLQQASGSGVADARAVSTFEAAACLYQRTLSGAKVTGPDYVLDAATPELLGWIGRSLITSGNAVAYIQVIDGRVRLFPACWWNITGGYDPEGYVYELNLTGPSSYHTVRGVPATSVLHVKYSVSSARPAYGAGPLELAGLSMALVANLEKSLSLEMGGPIGNVITLPHDHSPGTTDAPRPYDQLRADIKGLDGKTAFAETTSQGYGDGRGSAPHQDFMQKRIGPSPNEAQVDLQSHASMMVLSACCIPPTLFTAQSGSGQAAREDFRRWVLTTVSPLGKIIAAELGAKLDADDVVLSFGGLHAHDLQGRANAFLKLTQAGLTESQAAQIAGVMELSEV